MLPRAPFRRAPELVLSFLGASQEPRHPHGTWSMRPLAGAQNGCVGRFAATFAKYDVKAAGDDDAGADKSLQINGFIEQGKAENCGPDDLGILHGSDDCGLCRVIGGDDQQARDKGE